LVGIHKPEAQAKVIFAFEKLFACASGLSNPAKPVGQGYDPPADPGEPGIASGSLASTWETGGVDFSNALAIEDEPEEEDEPDDDESLVPAVPGGP